MKYTILRSVWAAALVAVAVVNSPPSIQAQSDPPPGMTLVTTGVPTFGTFLSLSGNQALLPMPFDVMPWRPLYVNDSDTNSYIYYIDDRGLDETLADVNSIFAIISSPPGSGVMVRGGGVHADDDGPPVPEGDEGGGSGSGGPAQGGIAPPGAGYTNCLSYINFFFPTNTPTFSGGVLTVTLTNTLPGLVYVLLDKTNLNQSAWFTNTPLTATGYTVTTNFSASTNANWFFSAMLATNDQAPTIIVPPTNQVVNSGGTATFYVTATGLAPLSYFWYLNGTNIPGADTNSLTISGVTSANAGIYTVVVSNAICEADASAGLGFTWTTSLTNGVWASPTIGSMGIFVPDVNGHLFCLNPVTGSVLWVKTVATNASWDITGSAALAADGSAVYVGTQDGTFLALNPTNGSLLWSNYLGGAANSSPAVANNGTIYVATDGAASALFALNPANGAIEWAFQANDEQGHGGAWDSSPAIEPDGSIVIMNLAASELYSVWPDGNLRWFFPLPSGDEYNPSPAIDARGDILIGDDVGYVYCISPAGVLQWLYDTGLGEPEDQIFASIAAGADGTAYVATSTGTIFAINNGVLRWTFSPPTYFMSSPAVTSDNVVIEGGAGNGTIFAVTNGVPQWTNVTGSSGFISSVGLSPVDGGAIIVNGDGEVFKVAGSPSPVTGAWPMFHRDASRSGAFPGESGSGPGVATAFPYFPSFPNTNTFTFYVSGATNSVWSVYASTNLVDWTLIKTNLTLNADGYTDSPFGESGISNTPQRFYHLVSSNYCGSPVIGYITQTYLPGTNLAANPFTQVNYGNPVGYWPMNSAQGWEDFLGENNAPFPSSLPNGAEIMKWNGAGYDTNTYNGSLQEWFPNGDLVLAPGQSFFFVNPTTNSVTLPFAGVLPYGTVTNLITPGTNFVSSIIPVAGLVQTDLGFTPHNGDDVLTWSGSQFLTHYYNNGWTNQPTVGVGQGLVIVTSQSNAWVTNFVPCQP